MLLLLERNGKGLRPQSVLDVEAHHGGHMLVRLLHNPARLRI